MKNPVPDVVPAAPVNKETIIDHAGAQPALVATENIVSDGLPLEQSDPVRAVDDEMQDVAASSAGGQPSRSDRPAAEIRFLDVVSGQFDADEVNASVAPPKRVLTPQAETPKLHKVLAQAGLGSRLEMEQLITEGRISVNNEPAHVGQRIQFGDQIKINGKPIRFRIDPPPARVIAYHKPAGEVVTHDDPQNRPTVFRKLPRLQNGKWQSVGRLDLNTEGLLLFTSSGELANNLMHPRFGLEREYAVRVLGALNKEEKQRLLDGVQLADGMAQFGSIEEGGGEGSNCWYRVTISEGRNREVRRMLEAVGHAVSRLIRIRYGAMLLPRGLKRGAWLELDDRDIQSLMQAANAGSGGRPGPAERGSAGADGNRNPRQGGVARGANAGGPGQRRPAGQPGPRRNDGGAGGGGRNYGGGGNGYGAGAGNGGGASGYQGKRRQNDASGDRSPLSSQPDPLKTSLGYIGQDSLTRFRQGAGAGGGQGPRRGGGGNGSRNGPASGFMGGPRRSSGGNGGNGGGGGGGGRGR